MPASERPSHGYFRGPRWQVTPWRPRYRPRESAWILVAHVLAAEALGGLEASRLGLALGRTLVPMFALTGLVIGCVVALTERVAPRSGWAAPVLALPTLAITVPMSLTLYDGAFAQSLPYASALPWDIRELTRVSPFSFGIYVSRIKETMTLEDPETTIERLFHEMYGTTGVRSLS